VTAARLQDQCLFSFVPLVAVTAGAMSGDVLVDSTHLTVEPLVGFQLRKPQLRFSTRTAICCVPLELLHCVE
jgi:hypothetical protein